MSSSAKKFVIEWNNKYPLDHWWRKKYNVPFGSTQHKEMTFLDMLIDFEEDRMFEEYKENVAKRLSANGDENDIIFKDKNVMKMTEEEEQKEFENLDISQFNEK